MSNRVCCLLVPFKLARWKKVTWDVFDKIAKGFRAMMIPDDGLQQMESDAQASAERLQLNQMRNVSRALRAVVAKETNAAALLRSFNLALRLAASDDETTRKWALKTMLGMTGNAKVFSKILERDSLKYIIEGCDPKQQLIDRKDVLVSFASNLEVFLRSADAIMASSKGEEEIASCEIVESKHPYDDSCKEYWNVKLPGAKTAKVFFDAVSTTERSFDFVKLFKEDPRTSTNQEFWGVEKYSGGRGGNEKNFPTFEKPLFIPSDHFTVYFESDGRCVM